MKLADTLYRVPRQEGLQLLHQRGDDLMEELSSWRMRLAVNEVATFESADEETVIVVQEGAGSFTVGDQSWNFRREGVFKQAASALYLPPGHEVTVAATVETEAVLIATPVAEANTAAAPAFVGPEQVEVLQRGRGHYQREVHNLFLNDDYCQRLMVGETFNPPGMWSSYPPHKHDGRDNEPRLEEVYHYRVDPPQGFAQQLMYTSDGESVTHTVRDGDAVVIPYGYHPIAAPPGYKVCYLWALSGNQRELALFEDPDHRWLHEAPGDRA